MTDAPRHCLFNSSLHGYGVQATAYINAGDVVFQEKPLHFLQTIPNRKSVIVCGSCLKPLGDLSTQIGILQGTISRVNIVEEIVGAGQKCTVVPCPACCGELYCSGHCRDIHWAAQGHRLLCTGHITDEEAEFHPLISFKVHAMSTNEIFLMVAELFASMVCQLDNLTASGVEIAQAFEIAAKPLSTYVRELWWDAAITPKNYKPAAFKKSLKTLVKDTWELLDEALQLSTRGYALFLSEEYLSRTIGMFEQNNVGVQMKLPLAEAVEQMLSAGASPDPAAAAFLKDSLQRILDNIDDDGMCCDEDGEYEDVEEGEDEEGEDDEGDEGEDEAGEGDAGSDGEGAEGMQTEAADADPNVAAIREAVEQFGLETLFPPLDGTAFYSTICHINHSCDPNVRVTYTNCPQRGLLATLVALRPITPGEELVQSYIDQFQSLPARQKALKDYGFTCTCPKCETEAQSK